MDKYQKFGIFTLLLSLFMFSSVQGLGRILYISGFVYSAALIFHKPIERFLTPKIKRPLFAYGILVLLNGLAVEVLAYYHNLPRILRGEQALIFSTESLFDDLLVGLPYYVSFALIFPWLVRRFEFTTFEFTFMVGLTQAMTTDVFSHVLPLFTGGITGILGFIFAAFTMLFTLNVSYVWFENRFKETYPARSRSWVKFPVGMVLQLIPMAVTFIFAFLNFNILPNFR